MSRPREHYHNPPLIHITTTITTRGALRGGLFPSSRQTRRGVVLFGKNSAPPRLGWAWARVLALGQHVLRLGHQLRASTGARNLNTISAAIRTQVPRRIISE